MYYFLIGLLLLTPLAASGQVASLTTRPEATDYRETSRYGEVMDFVEKAANASDDLHLTSFGYSVEGRSLPLIIFGSVADASPQAVLATGRMRVLVFANIHAGEVAGKEAMLVLLRDLASGEHEAWADSLVVLIAPIYNADGNERISLYNRRLQYGPVGGMGERSNAQGLDLNRDFMKLDAPESRSLVRLFQRYDPHVIIDLHTTNGSYHGYHLTYSPPLHPATFEPIVSLLRTEWLPEVTESIKEQYGWDIYYYGYYGTGYFNDNGEAVAAGWYTFSHTPRFGTNYFGLRNRFGILSEAYSYATFEERILASLYFVEEVIDFAAGHASEIRQITAAADAASVVGEELALSAEHARSEEPVAILMGDVEEIPNPYTGRTMLLRKGTAQPEQMYEYGTFTPTETEIAPVAYYVPSERKAVIDLLIAHGVQFEELDAPETLRLERFRIDSVAVADRVYQGHKAHTLFGEYEAAEVDLPAGTLVVPVGQPLGRLIFLLLEPRSDDGLVRWGILDPAPQAGEYYSIYRDPTS